VRGINSPNPVVRRQESEDRIQESGVRSQNPEDRRQNLSVSGAMDRTTEVANGECVVLASCHQNDTLHPFKGPLLWNIHERNHLFGTIIFGGFFILAPEF
jgi:hypothetical protein